MLLFEMCDADLKISPLQNWRCSRGAEAAEIRLCGKAQSCPFSQRGRSDMIGKFTIYHS